MSENQAKKIINALNIIRDSYNIACRKDDTTDLRVRASLATSAFNLASHLKPSVLEELYVLSVQASNRNLPPAEEISQESALKIDSKTIQHLAENIINHVGSEFVDPSLKKTRGP